MREKHGVSYSGWQSVVIISPPQVIIIISPSFSLIKGDLLLYNEDRELYPVSPAHINLTFLLSYY